jgi:hypothetical protein
VSPALRKRAEAEAYCFPLHHSHSSEPKLGPQDYAIAKPLRAVRANEAQAHKYAFEHLVVCTFTAAAVSMVAQGFYEPTCATGIDALLWDGTVIECKATVAAAQPAHSPRHEPDSVVGNILEMRPVRTSLAEKAQEELSEFEREYPW